MIRFIRQLYERRVNRQSVSHRDAVYAFVEPAIRQEWAKGAEAHMTGQMARALKHWTKAMKQQSALASRAKVDKSTRYFEVVWTCAIGHIALLATYAQGRALGLINTEKFVFVGTAPIANRAYLDYFNPLIELVLDEETGAGIDRSFMTEIPGVIEIDNKWISLNRAIGVVQQKWVEERREPLFKIKEDHHHNGWEMLRSWGIPAGAWFVTLHVRQGGRISGGLDTNSIRNADIEDYIDAIKLITAAGGWVIRIGGKDYTPLPSLPHVIDYAANKDHKDWLDVFLLGAARFVIATNSGPAWVANSFGVPILFTNWAPCGVNPFWTGARVLRKNLFLLSDEKVLPYEEQLKEPISQIELLSLLTALGYGVRENSSEEISQAVKDFIDEHVPLERAQHNAI